MTIDPIATLPAFLSTCCRSATYHRGPGSVLGDHICRGCNRACDGIPLSFTRIKAAVLWQNGIVMVFDESGEQIPALQGELTRRLESWIRTCADAETEFRGFPPDQPCVWQPLP